VNKNTPEKIEKILVIVAHADDEAIGCGGTLLKHKNNGDCISIIYMTDGVGARDKTPSAKKSTARENRLTAQQQACQQLNVSSYYNFDFPDNRMDQVALIDITQAIEPIISELQPTVIYTHHGGDLNIDHRIVHQAVLTACRPQPNTSVQKILSFEVNSSTEWASSSMSALFIPNYFVDISQYQNEKQQLLDKYQQEMKHYPHSRSIKAISYLNNVRGSAVGVESAEAFMLIRAIH